MGVNIRRCALVLYTLALIHCSGGNTPSGSENSATSSGSCSVLFGAYSCALNIAGNVSTVAGPAPGSTAIGDTDGVGNAARFNLAFGLTTDGTNIFIADSYNHKIRKMVIATGAVSTFAGAAQGSTTSGDADGTGTSARLNTPSMSVIVDGSLYVTDSLNNKIRKIVISTGVVTTFAGPVAGTTTSGDTDGVGNDARFNVPMGITSDGTNLYVSEQSNNKIRKIVIATQVVSTLAGPAAGATTSGNSDGTGNVARFNNPAGLVFDGTHLYLADNSNHRIRKISVSTAEVTTLAGPAAGTTGSGDADGIGNVARFNQPLALTTDRTYLYVSDASNHKVRKIAISNGATTTLTGPAAGTVQNGDTDGAGSTARFHQPVGISTDGTSLWLIEVQNKKVRKIQ